MQQNGQGLLAHVTSGTRVPRTIFTAKSQKKLPTIHRVRAYNFCTWHVARQAWQFGYKF